MIVLYGRADDPPLSLLIEALHDASAPYLLLELGALNRDGLELEAVPPHLHAGGQRVAVVSEPLGSVTGLAGRVFGSIAAFWR